MTDLVHGKGVRASDAPRATDPAVGVTVDAFLGGALFAAQPRKGYRAGLDTVLLAAAVEGNPGGGACLRVLDLGAGVGVVGLCIARRLDEAQVTLLERDPAMACLARQNIARNDLGSRVTLIETDLSARNRNPGLVADDFDHVVANPPFFNSAAIRLPKDAARAAAHAMPDGTLELWLRAMAGLTRPGGRASLIHRAEALPELLAAMGRRFGGVEIWPIHPRRNAPAHRVLVQATKASRAPIRIRPGLVLHDDTNAFRPDVARILREPVGLAEIAP